MAIRYNHVQVPKTSRMITTGAASGTVLTTLALTDAVVARFYIDPGFNGTLEWLEHGLACTLEEGAQLVSFGSITSAEWQIRCRGEAAFTKIADCVFPAGGNIGYDAGVSTSGNATTITDTGAAWPVNGLVGLTVTGSAGRTETILSNTATVITTPSGVTWSGNGYTINGAKSIVADGVYDAVAGASDTSPLELQLVATTDTAMSVLWTFPAATMAVRIVGVSA